jgi:hypothetical protein
MGCPTAYFKEKAIEKYDMNPLFRKEKWIDERGCWFWEEEIE